MSYANNKGRSACTSAQSDKRLYCSLLREYNICRFYIRNFKTLASFCGCAGQFVSGLVENFQRHVLSCRGSVNTTDHTSIDRLVRFHSLNEPTHEIMALFVLRKHILQNAHAQPSSGARCLIFDRAFHLRPYFMYVNSEGSGETARWSPM